MWFVVKTTTGKEEPNRDTLLSKVPIVSEVFLPMKMTSCRNKQGKLQYHTHPLISGYLFVDLKVELNSMAKPKTEIDFHRRVWNQLKKNVSPRGYFFYKDDDSDSPKQVAGTRLLSDAPENTCPDDFISKSFIRDEDMNPFMRYNGGSEFVNDEIQIIGESFEKLARVNDVVRIVTGPMAGATGVVVSKKQKSKGKNYKDRHLEVRLGNSLCVSYSNIRRFDMVIVREAPEGDKAWEPRLWHEVDHFIGLLQAKGHVDDAPIVLRKTLTWLHNKQNEPSSIVTDKLQKTIDNHEEQTRLLRLARALPFGSGSAKTTLDKYVSDCPIRPFLTPAEGDEAFSKVSTLQHDSFKEYVIPMDLQTTFHPESQSTTDYAYNAHVAVFTKGDNAGHAIVSWGRFYDEYVSMPADKRQTFHDDLAKKGYINLLALLTTAHPLGNPQSPRITFRKLGAIGGFAIAISGKQEDAARTLAHAVAPSAVEFWQKERLRNWRRLIQQSVLIHKTDSDRKC